MIKIKLDTDISHDVSLLTKKHKNVFPFLSNTVYVEKLSIVNGIGGKLSTVIYLQGCNRKCKYCFNKTLLKRPKEKPSIIYKIEEGMQKNLVISGGEPFLYKKINEYIKIACKYFNTIKIYTNGDFNIPFTTMCRLSCINISIKEKAKKEIWFKNLIKLKIVDLLFNDKYNKNKKWEFTYVGKRNKSIETMLRRFGYEAVKIEEVKGNQIYSII